MTTKDLETLIPKFYVRLERDGHSEEVKATNRWVLSHFQKYCLDQGIIQISMEVICDFLRNQYDIDLYKPVSGSQIAIRRPLLIFLEYSLIGTYQKSHLFEKTEVPERFFELYLQYYTHINSLGLKLNTKSSKLRFAKQFLSYMHDKGIKDISGITKAHIYWYLNANKTFSATTKQTALYNIRGMLDWMYEQKLISFSGHETFPVIRTAQRRFIPSCYTTEEIRKILDSVDTSTVIGKHDYLILSLLIYYGIRVSDIINLKFENIDWNSNTINIVQQKTNNPLTLPLIDEVKYPLIDYLKNARYPLENEHILVTLCAPRTCYKQQSFQRIVTKYMKKAGIDYSDKHHGTHAMRHSLASGLLNENVPISAISGILGHRSINTTDVYLTVDQRNLKEISLEVPHVSNS